MNLPLNIDLKGKVAVVTGGGGVLCSSFAQAIAASGAKVAVLDLNDLDPGAKADVREAMRREGFFQFGGGPEAEITMYEEGAWRELVASIEENHPGGR